MSANKRLNTQRGFLMIVAVIIVTVVSLLSSTLIYVYVSNTRAHTDYRDSQQAYNIARSGLQRALIGLENGNGSASDPLEQTYACDEIDFTDTVGDGEYHVIGVEVNPDSVDLDSSISSSDTTIQADSSVTNFEDRGLITIDDEVMSYTSIDTSTGSCSSSDPCFANVTRGLGDSSAASHSSGAEIRQHMCQLTSVGAVPSIASVSAAGFGERILRQDINIPEIILWAVGDRYSGENIMQSTDSETWARIGYPLDDENANGITFVNRDFGVIVSDDRTFYDWNGSTWDDMSVDTSGSDKVPNDDFNAVSCIDENFCMAVGDRDDGLNIAKWNGSTWKRETDIND